MPAKYLIAGASSTTVTDQDPDPYSFTNNLSADLNTLIYSDQITVYGLAPNLVVTVSCDVGEIDAGATVLSGTYETSKEFNVSASGTIVVKARQTSASSYYETTNQVITVGNGNSTWTVRTIDVDLIPGSDNRTFEAFGSTPSSTPVLIGEAFIQQLSPNATYAFEEYLTDTSGNLVEVGYSSTSPVTSFSTYNESSSTFTTLSSGEVYLAFRATLESNWLQSATRFYIKSSYSGDYDSNYTWSFRADTDRSYAYTPTNPIQTVASAGILFEWEIEFTNLPVSLGNLNFYFDADYFGTGGSFKNGEGYSLVSGGPYSTSLNITNHSSSTLTLYMAFESEATGLGNRRILNPYAQLSYTGGSGADNLRDWAEQFELLF